ncbi:bifunctional orotate phosphoribosyltransferase / orotidine-5'-phosphate decarboxylase isoform 1 [Galdieria sulphuraria]|uniref:Uridine 5'-monophosphate synthase n=1 Tax=Galdieria sulphuraria TaxID=130081 RepID=M2XDU8_GALSU|nr:bifunctional orotate phosphoribosyltransferase / orotidine-5'-phosphate decarboxylase isoform 1 [Galdieria sulphuraria]EME28177.1 bifunctional orotate phosphoribosyltransferase / orotidine-5'-phosphate decarboxylase isoform 1 [Galdieria sulphuraria]|eukprot:XP_005704697.1 bifunctional orotate phosphoribosyltransferase / orotidine-5'-phosphate decarboxylase isoform 1 [Galdieria sulphuraria]
MLGFVSCFSFFDKVSLLNLSYFWIVHLKNNMSSLDALIIELYDKQVIQVGSFQLKSGITSPIYIDLRLTISYPSLLRQVVSCLQDVCRSLSYDILCGVPYTALPFATLLSVESGVPMVMRRKEIKDYGTKKAIEGVFQPNQTCLIIEDLVTSGSSVLETLEPLLKESLRVKDVVVLLDREQGGKDNLAKHNVRLHSVLKMTDILETLRHSGRLSVEQVTELFDYFHSTKVSSSPLSNSIQSGYKVHPLSFEQRLSLIRNKVGRRLLEIMLKKQSNLAVAADVTTSEELLSIANEVGPQICILKTHMDIIQDWTESVSEKLVHLAKLHHFLIFEDRKFADIGNTVELQLTGGIFHIAQWADIVNAHIIAGPGTIQALSRSAEHCGILLLAQMSSKGNLAVQEYTQKALEFAQQYEDAVFGFISLGCIGDPNFLYFTPGVKLEGGGDSLGQQYTDPKTVIAIQGSDVAIVGRGIIQSSNRREAASTYRKACWDAYLQRLEEYVE